MNLIKLKHKWLIAVLTMALLMVWTPCVFSQPPGAKRLGPPPDRFKDTRYHHDRSYPARGHVVPVLPRDRHTIVHHGTRYHYSGGVWYRPRGGRFIITAPPIGLIIPSLPPFYTTIWVGGVPYYYANEVYYAHHGSGYIVVDPPQEEVKQVPPPAEQLFIYPRQGQDEKQQADDRYACHRWAVDQTAFDPTQPPDSMTDKVKGEKRADYQRAFSACLDGRGYTVK